MITDVVSWVILGVRAAARLSETARQQVISQTRTRTLTLPLPLFFAQTNEFDARAYFEGPGQHWLNTPPPPTLTASQQKELHSLLQSFHDLQPHQKTTLRQLHARCLTLDKLAATPDNLVPEEEAFLSASIIHSWQHDSTDPPSPLQSAATDLIQTCLSLQKALHLDFSPSSPITPFLHSLFSGLHTPTPASSPSLNTLANQLCQHALRWTSSIPLTSPNSLPTHLERTTRNTLLQAAQSLDHQPSTHTQATLQQAVTGFLTLLQSPPDSLPPPDHPQHDFLQWLLSQPPGITNSLHPKHLHSILLSLTHTHQALPPPTESLTPTLHPLLSRLTQTLADLNPSLLLPALPDYIHGLLTEISSLPPSITHDHLNPVHNLPLQYLTTTLQALAHPTLPILHPQPHALASLALATTRALCEQPGWPSSPPELLPHLLNSVRDTISLHPLPPHTRSSIFLAAIRAACHRFELTQAQPTREPLITACIQTTLQTLLQPDLPPTAAWQLHRHHHIEHILQLTLRALTRNRLNSNPIPQIITALQQLIASTSQGNAFCPRTYQRTLLTTLNQPHSPSAPCPPAN